MIPNCVPAIAGNEISYLREAIETGWLSSAGPFVDRFEDEFAKYHNVPVAAAVSSGTAAIHLGLIALGVRPGDLVVCPTLTFIGSVNPIYYCGAEPLFLDVQESTLNLDPTCLEQFLEQETETGASGDVLHRRTGRRVAAVIVVHLYGTPADMDPIVRICSSRQLPVLEDAAESLGALYGDRLVGTIGDIGCYSFNGNKIITSGGGGMLIGCNGDWVKLCKHLSTQAKTDPFEFEHDHVAFNYRLNNICAAVGVAQLEALDTFIALKRSNASSYARRIEDIGSAWEMIAEPSGSRGTYWMVLARYVGADSRPVLDRAKEWVNAGIGVRPLWKPLHTLPLFRKAPQWRCDIAEKLYRSVICLPSSVHLTEEDIDSVVEALACPVLNQ